MDISIFLAQALGIYLLIVSISMFLNPAQYKIMINEIANMPSMLFLSGIMALIIGILIVITHNVWVADWRVIITLLGWLSLLKGIIRVMFPMFALRAMKKFMHNMSNYYVVAFIALLLGGYLSFFGFV